MDATPRKTVNKLAWNTEITHRLRLAPMLWLCVLPIGLSFASIGLLYLATGPLSQMLGVEANQPIRGQENGIVWLLSLLVLLVILMLSGYRLGWALNGLVLRLFLKWPADRVREALLYSELPDTWLRASITTAAESPWAATRQLGKWRFVLERGVLAWGLPMFLIMSASGFFKGPAEPGAAYFLLQACLWAFGGLVFGLLVWHSSERSFRKLNNKTNSHPQEEAP